MSTPASWATQNLTWGAIRGMVESLGDTGHTVFLTPEQVQAESDQMSGRISGIGIMVDTRAGQPLIISVFDGSPADQAGLRAGDLITSVDGQPTERQTVDEVIKLVRGDAGTSVTLGITHRDGSTEEVPIVRAEIVVPPASWAFVPGTTHRGHPTRPVLARCRRRRPERPDGGARPGRRRASCSTCVAIRAASWTRRSTSPACSCPRAPRSMASRTVRASGPRCRPRPRPLAPDLPLVVLTDFGSASSAEIVAAALQDNGRAQVVGQKTFGTGTVLNMFPLSDGSAIMLGVIEWLTPKGDGIFDVGITPDVEVKLPSDGVPTETSRPGQADPQGVPARCRHAAPARGQAADRSEAHRSDATSIRRCRERGAQPRGQRPALTGPPGRRVRPGRPARPARRRPARWSMPRCRWPPRVHRRACQRPTGEIQPQP